MWETVTSHLLQWTQYWFPGACNTIGKFIHTLKAMTCTCTHRWGTLIGLQKLQISHTVDQLKCLVTNLHVSDMQSMPEYNEIIKTPMDLSKVRSKMEGKESPSYRSTEDFVADMRLIFKNCATFHKVWLCFLFDMIFEVICNVHFSAGMGEKWLVLRDSWNISEYSALHSYWHPW